MNGSVSITVHDGEPGGRVLPPAPAPPAPTRRTWTLRRRAVATVCELELRQRVRSTRWRLALLAWFVLVALVTLLTFRATAALVGSDLDDGSGTAEHLHRGPLIFGLVVFFVLLAGLLVAPTLSAGAINGDRNAGTLATLQVTLLSPAEIVVGKLLAGWAAALAFLVVSLPFVLVAVASGGVRIWSLVTTLVLLVVILGIVCAIGLGFSALVARTTGSALLTYLTVLSLVFGTVITFGLTFPLVSHDETLPTYEAGGGGTCVRTGTTEQTVAHTERTWWLLAPNPFVVVADAAPTAPQDVSYVVPDPLRLIRDGVRVARTGPASFVSWCDDSTDALPSDEERASKAAVWPWGLGFDLLLGAGAVWLAVRRLRIPQARLPRGTRVA